MAKGNPKFGRRTVRKTSTKRKVNKSKIKATKKTVDGIDFNSMLEVFTYRKLVEAGLETNYEAKSFTILPSFTYEQITWENRGKSVDLIIKDESNIRAITYTPDFMKFDANGDLEWVIECKGFANERFPNTWKMFKYYLLQKQSKLPLLFMPRNQKQALAVVEYLKTI